MNKRKPVMKILVMPSVDQIEKNSVEVEDFLRAFQNKSVFGFSAELDEVKEDSVVLDGWEIQKDTWFEIQE